MSDAGSVGSSAFSTMSKGNQQTFLFQTGVDAVGFIEDLPETISTCITSITGLTHVDDNVMQHILDHHAV